MPVIELANQQTLDIPEGQVIGDALVKAGLTDAIGIKVGDHFFDLQTPLRFEGTAKPVFMRTKEGMELLRHTAAHVMAQAVSRLFENVEFAIGPTIDDGFYYDFDLAHAFTPEDFPKIEAEMKKIAKEKFAIVRKEVNREEAMAILAGQNAKFKQELVQTLEGDVFSFYAQGEFTDLCRGPHLANTGFVPAFKILSVAGAYWRGDEKREMLQRLYATAFWTQEELDEHIRLLEEAKKRDHRKLGRDLDLFSFHGEGPGFPFWHPNGTVLYNQAVDFWRMKHREYGYDEIRTPMILSEQLWHQSGHWDHYRENMYFTEIDEKGFAVKPMNCPGGTLVYRSNMWSYRDLPARMAELGYVHRHEKSGVLAGLFRVRAFTQDDAHIYCTYEQLESEINDVIQLLVDLYTGFGFSDYAVELSTRPEKSLGSDEMWEKAEGSLRNVLERRGIDYKLNPGDGAFYGPKIDFHIQDAIKRTWQCGTIQVDFSMPERFDMEYTGPDGAKHRPVMIHRAILGSLERFLGILIEHYAGAFPTWLAPVQAVVIPISEAKFGEYAREVVAKMKKAGLRVKLDAREESLNYRIRDNQTKKIPYLMVVGGREAENQAVAIRRRDKGDIGALPVDSVIEQLLVEVAERRNGPTLGDA